MRTKKITHFTLFKYRKTYLTLNLVAISLPQSRTEERASYWR